MPGKTVSRKPTFDVEAAIARTQAMTAGERLRHAADQLYDLADRYDTPRRGIRGVEVLHDETETVADDVRAVVRGRGPR